MPLIQWDDSFSVKIGEIDRQHQKLVNTVNELSDAMRQGKAKDILGKIINELISYTGTHFTAEEKYFDQFAYPETSIHKREHSEFIKKVTDFKNKFDSGAILLSLDIMDFLSNWLQNHIKGADKKYSPFFREKGLN